MKQLIQNLGSGETVIADVPTPSVGSHQVLIATQASVVSVGTERMLVQFGRANLLDKARQQPDKVKQVLEKVKTDGLTTTMNAVKSKLDQPVPLGYCNAGIVLAVGSEVRNFAPGDRVVSNGPHSEVVAVAENLCAKIPEGVSYEEAAFTVLGAIALQGVRLIEPTLGETIVVTGLGLIGLLAVQLLRANGCRVLAIDMDPRKCEMARQFGAETVDISAGGDPVSAAMAFSRGRGVDGVVITAATKSNEPMHQAALMCRKRGRIVLTGVVGLELMRDDFYKKELSFQVSCSYGPGRYEEAYEDRAMDYPDAFVRWTAQRNFEAFLDMLASGSLKLDNLIQHRFPFERAVEAYDGLGGGVLGVVLEYPATENRSDLLKRSVDLATTGSAPTGPVSAAVLGAGNFSAGMLIPGLAAAGAGLHTVVSSGGVSGTHVAKKFGFSRSSTDSNAVFSDPQVNAVFITTRHDSHARYVLRAIQSGKKAFVEKPLAITRDELAEIVAAYQAATNPFVMVGFNRRFSPFIQTLKGKLDAQSRPKTMIMTVNAGALPMDHWTQNPLVGGGRIIGEGCHFIDLLRYLAGHPIVDVRASATRDASGNPIEDEATITLTFADGSVGTVLYLASGHRSFPKERLEVFVGEKIVQLDNFRAMKAYGWPGLDMKTKAIDKGHTTEFKEVVEAMKAGRPAPIPFAEIVEVTTATFDAVEQIRG
jgi:predicted dehydrogenase/threonine dehydrogenase-like Zn-dependent dehydrogenase